ncbi:MAG: CoA transferase [Anaerolineae bacterium]|nr:CoA transferase [Anaerolineales bacterium]MCQ3975723.1 CoA transferase [Anaerolineae bacterium]
MNSPLKGVRILDLTRLAAGGLLGMLLADFGAEVVKVEQPGVGDPLRQWKAGGQSFWWRVYGRNKRSITLNLKAEEGQQLFRQLVARFDVLLESLVPGTLEAWGLGDETLRQWQPKLIVVHISGWGQTGPKRAWPGFGTLAEASSGLAAMTGEPDGPPVLPPYPLADTYAALYACNGLMFALYHQKVHDGPGQSIDVSLFESVFSVLGPLAAEYQALGKVPARAGNRTHMSAPRGAFQTRDGHWLAVSGATPLMAQRFLTAYGLGHLLADERFATNEARVQHGVELNEIIAEVIATRTLAENQQIIDAHKLTAVLIQNIADIERDPHWQDRGLTLDLTDDQGTVRMHQVVPHLSATPGQIRWSGPDLGADNQAIYGEELGLSALELARLSEGGII